MLNKFFCLLSFCLIFCLLWSFAAQARTVKVEFIEPETAYDTLSEKRMRVAGVPLAFSNEETLGLAISEPFYKLDLSETDIFLTLGHKRHKVLLSEKVVNNACLYDLALKHEKDHVLISKKIVETFGDQMKRELRELIWSKASDDVIKERMRRRFAELESVTYQYQKKLDELDYPRIKAACEPKIYRVR